jgi:DUF3052 family protein
MAGYSAKPLARKLGIKENFRLRLINIPDNYFDLLSVKREEMQVVDDVRINKDFIHFFTKKSDELYSLLPGLKKEIKMNGMIWISWPKKASGVLTDVTEDMIRNYALETGLVDIKVCAVDETWSGLKLVIPVKRRT